MTHGIGDGYVWSSKTFRESSNEDYIHGNDDNEYMMNVDGNDDDVEDNVDVRVILES